jgi:hypothetical protein
VKNSHKEFWWGVWGLMIIMGVFLTLGRQGWPGSPDICTTYAPDRCFCEYFDRPGIIKQPANTWSNVGFVIVGLGILWHLGTARQQGRSINNPMTTATPYSITYGMLVGFLGPASMFFHGSLRDWGGWIDILSLILYGGFLIAYDVVRIWKADIRVFVALYSAIVGPLALVTGLRKDSGQVIFGVLIVIILMVQVRILTIKVGGVRRRGRPWLVLTLLTFGTAFFGIWLWSNSAGPLCAPHSIFQGHALWHVLTATSAACMYGYLRTERGTANIG